ncbi:hypothetical protein HU200_024492 [Digitaria exilis]|uniref:Uncharacterized protein n=1 Tax=Digitaria exilis TaxID=1010633 RepID=A0A835CBN3_9POAL|nr:hypothetical protein HU200_024492 [Digitaria exilis]CAB3461455.1 unnamed protein product [Digitaria exilis]
MEGLIPLLYKAIKERRSTAAVGGGGGGQAYYHATGDGLPAASAPVDLEDPEQRRRWLNQELRSPVHAAAVSSASSSAPAAAEGPLLHHRGNLSLEELAGEVGLSHDRRLRVPLPKARSVRAFACIGAA